MVFTYKHLAILYFGVNGRSVVVTLLNDCVPWPYCNAQESILRSYEHSEGKLTEAKGVAEIRAFFQGLFAMLTTCELLTVPVLEVTETPMQVYLVWDCPDSGVMSATDTFVYRSGDFKNIVQVRCLYRLVVEVLCFDCHMLLPCEALLNQLALSLHV